MSLAVVIYFASLLVLYIAERLLSGTSFNAPLLVVGVAGFIASTLLRAAQWRRTEDAGLRLAHRRILEFHCVALAGVAVYFVSQYAPLGDPTGHAAGTSTARWPVALVLASTVIAVLDHAAVSSPVVLPRQQVSRALWSAISAALAVALVFPVNYLAHKYNERWDFSYFRTATPGTATRAIIEQLPQPIDVRIFQPTSSDVLPELHNYFAQIDSPNLRVQVLDQAAGPLISRALRVRDNGYITFTDGEVDPDASLTTNRPTTQTVKIGTDLDEARGALKNLDKEVQKALLTFARGDINSYVTSGHGELNWASGDNPLRTMQGTKQILEYMNLDPKRLGLTEGLAEGVPDDADVVLVLGPDRGFLKEEIESLRAYMRAGGSLLLAIEPKELRVDAPQFETEDTMQPLLDDLGLNMGEGVLAATNLIVPTANNISDRHNIATDGFSSHPSTAVLSKNRGQLKLFTPGAGYLVEKSGAKPKTTVTVRSIGGSWNDRNMNLQLDEDQGESKTARPIAVAVEGDPIDGERGFRAIVVADATLFSDFPITNPGNQQFVYDALNWLTSQEAHAGEVVSEEDVLIQHTREGQAGWFYTTVVGVPLLFLAFGAARLRIRRRGGSS